MQWWDSGSSGGEMAAVEASIGYFISEGVGVQSLHLFLCRTVVELLMSTSVVAPACMHKHRQNIYKLVLFTYIAS